eukprot:scaffold64864_cov64-Phaeocystis_antarctica.AAC.6
MVDEKHTLVRVHAGRHLATSRERRDAHPGCTSIGVGTCLRLNLEPRRLLYIIGVACRLAPCCPAPSSNVLIASETIDTRNGVGARHRVLQRADRPAAR